MDTNDLITSLSNNAAPVRRIGAPLKTTGLMAAVVAALVALVVWLIGGPRPDLMQKLQTLPYLFETGAMLLAGLLSALSAMRLRVPDTKFRLAASLPLGLALSLWTAIILYDLAIMPHSGVMMAFHNTGVQSLCLRNLVLLSLLPLGATVWMMHRAATVRAGYCGFAALLSVASFAALGMRVFCPDDSAAHLLVWHFLPVLALAGLGYLAGRFLFKKF